MLSSLSETGARRSNYFKYMFLWGERVFLSVWEKSEHSLCNPPIWISHQSHLFWWTLLRTLGTAGLESLICKMGNMFPDSLSYWEDMWAPFPEYPLVLSSVELSVTPVALVTVHSKLAQGEANLLWFFHFLFSRGPNVADTTHDTIHSPAPYTFHNSLVSIQRAESQWWQIRQQIWTVLSSNPDITTF